MTQNEHDLYNSHPVINFSLASNESLGNDLSNSKILPFSDVRALRMDKGTYKSSVARGSSVVKNNNPNWHCLSECRGICKFCHRVISSGGGVVNHYVNNHAEHEVVPSRVTPEVAKCMRSVSNVPKCEIVRDQKNRWRYHQLCPFCNNLKCYNKQDWINHISSHSGNYKFKCTGCSKKFSTRSGHACTTDSRMITLERDMFESLDVSIVGYLCDVCNFVRFDMLIFREYRSD